MIRQPCDPRVASLGNSSGSIDDYPLTTRSLVIIRTDSGVVRWCDDVNLYLQPTPIYGAPPKTRIGPIITRSIRKKKSKDAERRREWS